MEQVSKPAEPIEALPVISRPVTDQHKPHAHLEIVVFLVLIGILILSSASMLLLNVLSPAPSRPSLAFQDRNSHTSIVATKQKHATSPTSTTTATPPIFAPNNVLVPQLQLSTGHSVIFEQPDALYSVSSTGGTPQRIQAPEYVYNQSVRPILTPSGQIIYTGSSGIWLMAVLGGTPQQIASLLPGQEITSMSLSNDGTTIAWSTEPADGSGMNDLYAGPLSTPQKIYEQPSTDCPCFRVFAFAKGDTTLLLTDDRQSDEAVQYGLWSVDLTQPPPADPQLLLSEDSLQGPLSLAPNTNVLLFSTNEGVVSMPSDGSVPPELATLTYANSLDLAELSGLPLNMSSTQIVLPEQHGLNNNADYHWITTPVFTNDGHTLLYIVFSSDAQAPFDRHSALYMVQVNGSGMHLHVGKPQLLATSNALLLELGAWFNSSILTFYGDGMLYALDIHTGAVASIAQVGTYARIITVVGSGKP